MKLDKLLLALLVIGVVLFAVPASVHAQENNSELDEDTEETDNEDLETDLEDENESELEDEVDDEADEEAQSENEDEAEDENETEIEYEEEIEVDDDDVSITKYSHGMEVRLLQLQKSVVKHINVGKSILEEIDNQNFSVDTDNLENYLDDMNDLNDRITEELAQDPVDVTTEQFVAMKHEAIKLTYQFKAEIYDLLTPEQLNIIKDALKDKMKVKGADELKVEEKFKLKVKEHNQEVALKMLEKFGGDNEELKAKILAGELGAKELKVELREEYKNLGDARKNQLKIKIKEEKNTKEKEKFELEAKVRGLNGSEVAKIASDKSLTAEEKQAKLRVLIEQQKEIKAENKGRGN